MKIKFKKMVTTDEIGLFWEKKRCYEQEAIFPNLVETGAERQEIIEWFESEEYYEIIMDLHDHPQGGGSALQFVFIYDDQESYLGFTMYKIYTQEDGKAFVFDFCIEPESRNQGLGAEVFRELEKLLQAEGGKYVALNTSNQNNQRFWQRQGFVATEADENGEIVYVKK